MKGKKNEEARGSLAHRKLATTIFENLKRKGGKAHGKPCSKRGNRITRQKVVASLAVTRRKVATSLATTTRKVATSFVASLTATTRKDVASLATIMWKVVVSFMASLAATTRNVTLATNQKLRGNFKARGKKARNARGKIATSMWKPHG